MIGSEATTSEWIWHKTADGLHPDGEEQQMVWLMNRARNNPAEEGAWLADTGDPDVEFSMDHFGVNEALLVSEFAAIEAMMPCAFDRRLYEAARQHAEYMISEDRQTHDQQQAFIDASGFQSFLTADALSAYYAAKSGLHAHCGFNVDWSTGPDGMLPGRGHRLNLMAAWSHITFPFSNCGIALVPKSNGELSCSANYSIAQVSAPAHSNFFIVGTVYDDTDGNGGYDPGEGVNGVVVQPDVGAWHAVTGVAGGYAIPAGGGSYNLTFSGGGLPFAEITVPVDVITGSVVRDIEVNRDGPVTAWPVNVGELRIGWVGPESVRLSWDTESGIRYDLEESDTPDVPGSWSARESDIDGTDAEIIRTIPLDETGAQFFRISARRP